MTALFRGRLLRPTAVTCAAAVLLYGCAAPAGPSGDQRSPGGNVSAGSAPGLPPAADGTDLAACADAACEVEVAEGDEFSVTGPHGLDRIVVEKVTPGTVTLTGYGGNGSSVVSGTTGAPFGDRPSIVLNGIAVAVLAVADDRAVIRLHDAGVGLPDLPGLDVLGN